VVISGIAGKNNQKSAPGAKQGWIIQEKKRRSFKMEDTKYNEIYRDAMIFIEETEQGYKYYKRNPYHNGWGSCSRSVAAKYLPNINQIAPKKW